MVLLPALATLAVTLLRLIGELRRWSELFFDRSPGGPGSLVGIVRLAPIFGIYFASKLQRLGHRPASATRMLGASLLGAVVGLGAVSLGQILFGHASILVLPFRLAGTATALWLVWRPWPDLARVLLSYAVAARLPVAVIMLAAIHGEWGTHYDVSPPGFPEMGPLVRWLIIGLAPQATFWVVFTVTAGGLFGAAAVLCLPDRRSAHREASLRDSRPGRE